jgi:hypothetical protein
MTKVFFLISVLLSTTICFAQEQKEDDYVNCTSRIWTLCEKPATFSTPDTTNIRLLKDAVKSSGMSFSGSIILSIIINMNGEIKEVNVSETTINNFSILKSLFEKINYKFNPAMQNGRKICFFQNVKISIKDDVYEIKCLK